MSKQLKIAIIGAGPGGLSLANLLQKQQIPFTIYESDASPDERNQGGSLDFHPSTGQRALREAGLWDEFTRHARPEADVMKIVSQKTGEVLWDENGKDALDVADSDKFSNRPEIDRRALRQILLAPLLETGCIKWGTRIAEVVPGVDQRHDLHFKDGTEEKDFDLVVGADGAWSKVRRLITQIQPYYSGVSAIELQCHDADTKNPWMSEFVGRGNCFSFGEGRAIQIQRQGDGSIRTYASLRQPESFLQDCGIDWTRADSAREEYVRRYFSDCSEDLKRVLLESRDFLTPRPLYMLPVGVHWTSVPGLTVLGDAAHLMTPFAGVGVNCALADSLDLANTIISYYHHQSSQPDRTLADSIQEYETAMFVRGTEFATKTNKGLIGHFSAGGSEEMVSRLRAKHALRMQRSAS